MNIRVKLTLQFIVLVSTMLAICFSSIYFFTSSYLDNRFYVRLKSKAVTAAELLINVQEVDAKLLKVIDKANKDILSQENIAIFNYKNQKLYRSNDSINFNITPQLLNKARLDKEVIIEENGLKIIGLPFNSPYNRVVVFAGAKDVYTEATLEALCYILVFLFILMVVVVGIAGWFFAGRALSPISLVVSQVNEIYPYALSNNRVKVENSKDEIGILAQTFNELLERTYSAFKQQRFFISNISHELRNPLARMYSQLEVTRFKERSQQEYKEVIDAVMVDLKDLTTLSNTLLELSKIENGYDDFLFEPHRIDELIWDAKQQLEKTYPEYIIEVDFLTELDHEGQLIVLLNPYLLKVAILNLMENACKFSTDSRVEVGISWNNEAIQIDFSNIGSGLAQDELERIFHTFYRSDKTAQKRGYGIGLALVKQIIKLHKGQITVPFHSLEKTTFRIQLLY